MGSIALLLLLPAIMEVSCTFSLFLPEKYPQEQFLQQAEFSQPQYPQQEAHFVQQADTQGQDYSQQGQDYSQQSQDQTSSVYWPDSSQASQQYQEGLPGYRVQAYQSAYRHQVQSLPYAPAYASPIYDQLTHPSSLPYHPAYHQQLGGAVVVPTAHGAQPTSVPVYQLVTMGPELPVLIRLPNQQTAVLPVRTVYSLPNFLERIVQRVQNYYSVYNPLEIPRKNETDAAPSEGEVATQGTTAASAAANLPDRIGTAEGSTTTAKATTQKMAEDGETTTVQEATTTGGGEGEITTEGNELQGETTTTK